MDFTKISYERKAKAVTLRWQTLAGKDTVKHELESSDVPAPALPKALDAFLPEVLKLLKLPTEYGLGLEIRGLSINYEEDGRRGVVVTCLKSLDTANSPLVMNTPHLREFGSDDEGGIFMPSEWEDLLNAAVGAAKDFSRGIREQAGLFDQAAD